MKEMSFSFHKSKTGQGVKDSSHANAVTNHNIRGEKNPKSNDTHYPEQSKFNKILIGSEDIKKDIENAYEKHFEKEYAKWDKKQRKERRGKYRSYLDKMNRSKFDIANESIISFGSKADFPNCINNWQNKTAVKEVFMELAEQALIAFQEEYPNEEIVNAVIHFDESTPHLHVVSVSVHEGYNGPKFQHLPSLSFTPNIYEVEPRFDLNGKRMINKKGEGCNQRVVDENGDYIILEEGTLSKGQTNIRNRLNEHLEANRVSIRLKEKSKGRGFDYTVDEYKAKVISERLEEVEETFKTKTDEVEEIKVTLKTKTDELEDVETALESKTDELKKTNNLTNQIQAQMKIKEDLEKANAELQEQSNQKQEQIEKNKKVLKDQRIDAQYLVESRVTTDVDIEDAVMIALKNITSNNNISVHYKEIKKTTKQAIQKVDNRNAKRLFNKLHCDNEQTTEQEPELEF